VEKVRLDCPGFFTPKAIAGLHLPKLTSLSTTTMPLTEPACREWFYALPSLTRLQAGYTKADGQILDALGAAPWWSRLTYFEWVVSNLTKTTRWRALWEGRTFALRTLCLQYLNTQQALDLLSARFPDLEFLAVGHEIDESFLDTLARADLPSLRDIELRFTGVRDIRQFAARRHPGLPKLERIGITAFSDREETYHDWDGSVVGRGNVKMDDREVQEAFFRESPYRLLPSDSGTWQRFNSSQSQYAFGWFMERPK